MKFSCRLYDHLYLRITSFFLFFFYQSSNMQLENITFCCTLLFLTSQTFSKLNICFMKQDKVRRMRRFVSWFNRFLEILFSPLKQEFHLRYILRLRNSPNSFSGLVVSLFVTFKLLYIEFSQVFHNFMCCKQKRLSPSFSTSLKKRQNEICTNVLERCNIRSYYYRCLLLLLWHRFDLICNKRNC